MEKYLTDKSIKTPWWEYLIIIASILLVMVFIYSGVKYFVPDNPIVSVATSATLILLAALPLTGMLIRRDRRNSARMLAETLNRFTGASIAFNRMDGVTGVKDAAWKAYGLLRRGYLRGIVIDQKNKTVLLSDGSGA